jgi:FkbM family methyltransferase
LGGGFDLRFKFRLIGAPTEFAEDRIGSIALNMDLLFALMKWNQRLKKSLPSGLVREIRNVVESRPFLWQHKYFSQFGEDAVLQNILREKAWAEAFKTPGGQVQSKTGFYVDIGAFAPIQHSNTYWFYQRGWRGINIDAAPGSMQVFRRVRGRDINLELAVSDKAGDLTYYCWGIPNVMNTTSKEVADKITLRGGQPPEKMIVKARTLEQILDEHLPSGQVIDFLTVDVENHNFEVLKSNNWTKYKPRIVLAEADDDCNSFETLVSSGMCAYLKQQGYQICGWIKPTIVFELVEAKA